MKHSDEELDALIEEATVDCYNDAEQATGLYTMIEENVVFPFKTKLLGSPVTVEGVDFVGEREVVAIPAREGAGYVLRRRIQSCSAATGRRSESGLRQVSTTSSRTESWRSCAKVRAWLDPTYRPARVTNRTSRSDGTGAETQPVEPDWSAGE